MRPCTVTYGHLRVDWDKNGTMTLARDDYPGSIQLSISEWEFVLRCAGLMNWPISPPVALAEPNQPAS